MTEIARVEGPGRLSAQGASSGVEGWEGFDQSDIIVPRWAIVQATASFEGAEKHAGEFRRNIDGEFRPHLHVVIIQPARTRLLWPPDISDRRPECFSRDAINGSRPREHTEDGDVYGSCLTCDYNAQYNRELMAALQADQIVRSCGFGYTYLVCDDIESQQSLAFLGAMGTSVRPAKTLNSQFISRRRPPFSAVVLFETERQTNDRGKFYMLKPSILKWLTPAETQPYAELAASLRGVSLRDYEPEELGDEPAAANGTPVESVAAAEPSPAAQRARAHSARKQPTEEVEADDQGLPF